MSDTPRTDEKVLIAWECFAPTKYVPADFARQLERENAALRDELKSVRRGAAKIENLKRDNAALRAALERLVAWGDYPPNWATDRDLADYRAAFEQARAALAAGGAK